MTVGQKKQVRTSKKPFPTLAKMHKQYHSTMKLFREDKNDETDSPQEELNPIKKSTSSLSLLPSISSSTSVNKE